MGPLDRQRVGAVEAKRPGQSVADNPAVDAAITTLVSLALVCFLGYFAWWQPTHAVDAHRKAVIERMEESVHATASRGSVLSRSAVPPPFKVNAQTLTTPGQQLQGDDDSSLSDNGSSNGDIASGIGDGG